MWTVFNKPLILVIVLVSDQIKELWFGEKLMGEYFRSIYTE